MTPITENLTLADGRTLDVFLGGDPAGTPLLIHHGTPSCATTFANWHEACAARNLRLLSMSRPGYATSTRLPGRNVAHAAQDAAELLTFLGHTSFYTAGWSGGGPHALACAALLPQTCRGAALLAGVAPYGEPDLDFLEGMGPENIEEFGAALKGEETLRAWKHANVEPFRHVTGAGLAEAFGGLVPQIDKDELTGGYAETMATAFRRALAPGFNGWIDDDLAFTKPWGFNLATITVPITIWQGDLDLMVPFSHGAWLAKSIPTATLKPAPGHGHISLVTQYQNEILDDLANTTVTASANKQSIL
jgi:pimeloyl-ACP methyl ester carboxylesterase